MAKPKITDKDLYELLEILSSATEQEIKKAYRKKALKCHPDKNPDNPKAAELFHELSAALEILTDTKAREAYDRTLKAKELAKQRTKELDAKRRKLKEDLERRERQAKESASSSSSKNNLSDEERLLKEIERLQKEGSRALREEQEIIRQQILKEQQGKFSYVETVHSGPSENNTNVPRIKVKWSSSLSYDNEKITSIFKKYGKVNEVVVLKKSALIEFDNQMEAELAFTGESCIKDNPLKLEWISKHKQEQKAPSNPVKPAFPSFASSNMQQKTGDTATDMKNFNDFEAMILEKLALAAAEQKKAALAKTNESSIIQSKECEDKNGQT